MKNAQDFNTPAAHTIRDQVTRLGDRQFAGPGHPARPPESRAVSQQLYCMNNTRDDLMCRLRIVLGNIGGLVVKIE